MSNAKFDDIVCIPLAKIQNTNGNIMRILKNSDESYSSFGEAYFSEINAGAIKAWKRHTKMHMNLVVPIGSVRFVFFIENQEILLNFKVIEIGEQNYQRLFVPPGIWFGMQGLGASKSLILNISSTEHDPHEIDRREENSIMFNWNNVINP